MNKYKIGDLVKITDGSYAIRIDKYKNSCSIGLNTNDFKIVSIISKNITCFDGTRVHDTIIEDTITGNKYLHTLAFVEKVEIRKIIIDDKEIELSEESYQALKQSLQD